MARPTAPRPLAEQVVVVAGASSGIGRATALELARRGARVACAARTTEALDTLVTEIQAAGGSAVAVPTDVADAAAVRRLAAETVRCYGRIDTWVNVAGVSVWGTVEQVTDEEFARVLQVNVLGHVHGVHAALPALRAAGGGVIVGVASAEGARAVPLQAPYVASKFALRGFYDSLRMELLAEGVPIFVSTVLPAGIDTPFFEHARSKIGALPKPPPPVYAPELVAEAIATAAVHPRREVPVGGAAPGFVLSQRLSPALTDAVLALVGRPLQTSDHPETGTDNLDGPVPGPGRVHGRHPGTVIRRSRVTRVLGALPSPGEALGAVLRSRRGAAAGSAGVAARTRR